MKQAVITVTLVVNFYDEEDPIDVMTKDVESGDGWEGTGKRIVEVIEPHVDSTEEVVE